MQIDSLGYEELPFTPLFRNYVECFDKLKDFYHYDPFREESFRERARHLDNTYDFDRERLAEWLTVYNQKHQASAESLENIERLKENDAVVIVTGQQVNLLGGPLYTVYKTLSVIQLAEFWEQRLGRPVIPVFWMADEDHDYEEIKRVVVPKSDEVFDLAYERPTDQQEAVAHISLDQQYVELRSYLKQELADTSFSDDLWSIIDDAYQEGQSLGRAFGRLLMSLFSSHGLVLAGSNEPEIKKEMAGPLKKSVNKADVIREALEQQSRDLSRDFHQQVTIYDSNLFIHSERHGRLKIHREDGSWQTEEGHEWTAEALIHQIEETPEKFSPNVFLRPILQDYMFPTLGYVGGPGEVAYYGQMRKMYAVFDLQIPIVFPRMSATLLESNIDRIYHKLPFEVEDYQQRIEDLESTYARQAEDLDFEELFEEWKEQIQQLSDQKTEQIKEIDPTLVKAVGKATAVYFNELDKLKGKVHRSTKEQEEIQLKRIRKIKYQLFPEDNIQERVISFVYYMNKYGLDLWTRILGKMSFKQSYREHQIIRL